MSYGEDNQTIADRLGMARATVSKHQEHIHEKLDVHSGIDAVLKGLAVGIFSYLDQ
jgi:DNA-binding NarL/FixJ family response regulator